MIITPRMTNKTAGIIGFPISHSRSPMIHGFWLKTHGLEGEYIKQAVKPEDLQSFIAAYPFLGGNVTIPHKETIMPFLHHVSEAAKKIGAVNMVYTHEGKLYGENTDMLGFLHNCDEKVPGWDKKTQNALVLGAGGAARAIIVGLQTRGFSAITLTNRSLERAQKLGKEFDLAVIPWEKRDEAVLTHDFIVNTTSLGMQGQPPLELNIPATGGKIFADAVYIPLTTDFLLDAKAKGHAIITGLGMLLHQAVPGFEKWFHVKPSVTPELYALVEADILERFPST
jgi:shikimate dehydrogenase